MHSRRQSAWLRASFYLLSLAALLALAPFGKAQGLTSSDLSRFRFVGDAALSPDGHRIAYTVILYDRPGRPSPQLWIMDLSTQKPIRIGGEKDVAGNPRWSPDGKWLAFQGRVGEKHGLLLTRPDGSEVTTLVEKMRAPTARCRARARTSRGHPTANRSRSFLRLRTKGPPKPAAIPWSSRATYTSRTLGKA